MESPARGVLHLWTLAIDAAGLQAGAAQLLVDLPAGERREATTFRNEARRCEFIVGRALLHHALYSALPHPTPAWQIERDANGKPFVSAAAHVIPPEISVSHTDGLVACLVGSSGPAAVDVERIEHHDDLPATTKAVFASSERAALDKLSGRTWTERFFDYWTLKEAYAKARGVGLQMDFRRLAMELDPVRLCAPHEPTSGCEWSFWRLRLSSAHAVSVAALHACGMKPELVSHSVGLNAGGFVTAA